ncbi:MAG: hypothetical protein AAFY42_11365, partial [Pseudomonadota bacterium]
GGGVWVFPRHHEHPRSARHQRNSHLSPCPRKPLHLRQNSRPDAKEPEAAAEEEPKAEKPKRKRAPRKKKVEAEPVVEAAPEAASEAEAPTDTTDDAAGDNDENGPRKRGWWQRTFGE